MDEEVMCMLTKVLQFFWGLTAGLCAVAEEL
jgi:hypothetical protein